MENWQQILEESVTSVSDLSKYFAIDTEDLESVARLYPVRINPYYLKLIKEKNDPIWRQAIPDPAELYDSVCLVDPLDEENLSVAPNLVHKYPDRALFLVNSCCAMYCRFCTRKRKVGTKMMAITEDTISAGLAYIRDTPTIRDVLVSGGDPLLLEDDKLAWILENLKAIKHVDIIRIGTRVPCVLPMRITEKLTKTLRKFHPLFINTHFNHPSEITSESIAACTRLVDAGIPVGCQTVLLKGVNDTPKVIKDLMWGLLKMRVKPYYLFQGDMTRGTDHFRTKISTGIGIMKSLIGHTSGMAIPHFALDAPGGGGKIPLLPNYVQEWHEKMVFTNYCGKTYSYTDGY